MTIATETFARRLREERQRAGLSQAALAGRLSELVDRRIDPSALARSETGERAVRLDEAAAIADILDVPLGAMLRDRDAVDDEIHELQRDLGMAKWRAGQAEAAFQEAQDAMQGIRRRIAALEATGGD